MTVTGEGVVLTARDVVALQATLESTGPQTRYAGSDPEIRALDLLADAVRDLDRACRGLLEDLTKERTGSAVRESA
jgi:hypothetical protein